MTDDLLLPVKLKITVKTDLAPPESSGDATHSVDWHGTGWALTRRGRWHACQQHLRDARAKRCRHCGTRTRGPGLDDERPACRGGGTIAAYRALLAEHDRQNAVPAPEIALPALPATAAAVAQEIGAIEHVMRTDRRAYDRDEGMQARLRQLYEAREAAGGSALPATYETGTKPTQPTGRAADPHRALIEANDQANAAAAAAADASWRATPAQFAERNPQLAALWQQDGVLDAKLRRAQDQIMLVLAGIGDTAAIGAAQSAFDGLPPGARAAVLAELGSAAPGYVRPLDQKELAAFELIPNGGAMLRGWGKDATRRATVAIERFNRIVAGAGADRAALERYWQHAPAAEKTAVIWALGSVE